MFKSKLCNDVEFLAAKLLIFMVEHQRATDENLSIDGYAKEWVKQHPVSSVSNQQLYLDAHEAAEIAYARYHS